MTTSRTQEVTAAQPDRLQGGTGGVRLWVGRLLSALVAAFLLFDGLARTVRFAPYVEGTVEFGYPVEFASWIGLTLVVATVLYSIPRTSVLGAILLTGYLGGATASHVQRADPWFLFAVGFGVLAWGGLYLRDERVRALLPLRRTTEYSGATQQE
ncbi:MAG: DoxX family protein [Gemmatimonas sp.]|nr:DoxX family protein [Gemmatimonas sp.]